MAKGWFLVLVSLVCMPFTPANADSQFVPILEEDFADAFVMLHDGTFYAYATNPPGNVANVQMATSTNLADWSLVQDGGDIHDAMPELPGWAREGFTWAPEVLRTADGFVIYITARERESGLQCVGAAFAKKPTGPFVSNETEPMVCQRDLGGTIDAAPFRDSDGQFYLYYKNDGNNPKFAMPTYLYAQKMSADGLKLEGEPVALIRNDQPWEAHVIEAPTMVKTDDGYALFYSSNHYGWEKDQRLSPYAMGWAKCEGPTGPCTKSPDNPILYSFKDRDAGCLSGPGHQSIVTVGDRQFVSFHAWAATPGCRKLDNKRYLYISPLLWKDGEPQLGVSLRPTRKN